MDEPLFLTCSELYGFVASVVVETSVLLGVLLLLQRGTNHRCVCDMGNTTSTEIDLRHFTIATIAPIESILIVYKYLIVNNDTISVVRSG